MKAQFFASTRLLAGIGLGLICSGALVGAAQSDAQTNVVTKLQEFPKSVFTIPVTAKDGRNPFFPYAAVAAQPVRSKDPIDSSVFVLNGITPSGPKRTAMINGRTFETGETGEVRLPSGARVLIKCEEIHNDAAVISIDGQRRELKLRFGL